MPTSPSIETSEHSACPLAGWTAALLASHEGTRFEMDLGNGEVEPVTLISVTESTCPAREGGRLPFSLVFRSGRRDFHAPQGCRRMRHDILGEVDIFLVPLGPDGSGMCYEAVFN